VSALEPGGLERVGSGPGHQVWLDLEDTGPAAPDPEALDRWLEAVGSGPEPPLVVLLGDDAAARARTHRLAVDRPGRVLLVREGAGGGACALGRPALLRQLAAAGGWRPSRCSYRPRRPSGGHLMVLDVDGVLIDPGRAFLEAVAGALEDLAPDLAWGDEDYLRLKRAGGFNNDFRLAAAALALAERGGTAGPLPERRIRALEPRCQEAVRRHYARTRCLERALVRPEHLAGFPGDLAVFTGRPAQELSYAFDLLGFRLPAVGDSAPHLRKPRPEGLIQLADAFRAGRVTFVGDSRDDAAALRGARALRPEIHWTFAAVGADRAGIAGPGDLLAPGLTDLLGGWP
jgi:phosphoglycolate phosphatase-like HAD superfamily hydrolase